MNIATMSKTMIVETYAFMAPDGSARAVFADNPTVDTALAVGEVAEERIQFEKNRDNPRFGARGLVAAIASRDRWLAIAARLEELDQ